MADKEKDEEPRRLTAQVFRYAEQAFYVAIAIALAVAGVMLFGHVIYRFVDHIPKDGLSAALLDLLDGVLQVFIIAELIHTVRAVIEENVVRTEPFLIIGIVASIRRLIVITAEAEQRLAKPGFDDLMLETGLLVAAVLVLGVTIFLVRHTESSEPRPAEKTAE